MKKHKILTVFSLFTLVMLGLTAIVRPPTKVSAYIEPNAHKVSSDYVRILVAPDGDAKKDNWNKDGAITAIVVLEDGADPVAKGGELEYGVSETVHLIEHDRQYRPATGNYALGGSGATDYVANGNKGLKLWYFNVRYDLINGKRFQVARLKPEITNGSYKAWNITQAVIFSDANITKAWKVELGSGDWSNLWFSGSVGNTLSNISVSYVLEGYMTCSPSSLNGYMAYPGLNATYSLDGRTANPTVLKDFDYLAYDENTTYAEGRPNDSGAELTTVGEKVTKMKALYEAATGSGTNAINKTLNYINIIVVIGLIGLTSLFGIYILKRKPRKI